jgi:uncharacterized protein YjbI with pentapeptide repeats
VFVSYVRDDSARVDRVCEALAAAALPYWRDLQDLLPGGRWREDIRGAIRSGSAFLAFFSNASESRDRSYMREELRIAVEELRLRPRDRPWFIPIRLEPCDIPAIDLGGGELLSDLHHLDLFETGEEEGISRLLSMIKESLESQAGQEGAPARSPGAVGLDGHEAILRAVEALAVARDRKDTQTVQLHLDRIRVLAETHQPLRLEIARVAANLLRDHDDPSGSDSQGFQQLCIDVLAACFSKGTPFTLTPDQRLRYPESMNWLSSTRDIPCMLDLGSVRFRDVDFSGLRLAAIDFRSATFLRCSFVGAYFECCDFTGVRMDECVFAGIHAILDVVLAEGNWVVGEQSQPEKSVLECLYSGEDVPTRTWHHLAGIFKFCMFREARFINVSSSGSCFWSCDLSRIEVGPEGRQMRHVDFSGSDLSEARFQGCDLVESLFNGCDLRYASFKEANLWMATIDTPLLLHAFFEGANLAHVAGLEKHKEQFLSRAIWNEDTVLPSWARLP